MKKIGKIFEGKTLVLTVLIVWILLYVTLSFLDARYEFMPWFDIKLYHKLAGNIFNGGLPYIDFYFEYPPASAIFFALPRLFGESIEVYRRAFEVMAFLSAFFTALLSEKILKMIGAKFKGSYIIANLSLMLFIQLTVGRYDIFAVLLAILSLYAYIRGMSSSNERWKIFGYVLLVIGALVKMYPGFLLPLYAIYDLKRRNIKLIIKSFLISFILAAPFLLLVGMGFEGVKFFLEYHGSRGLEIESIYSGVLLFINQIGLDSRIHVIYSHASYGVDGGISRTLANLSTPLFFLLLFGIYVYFIIDNKINKKVKLVVSQFAVVVLFVITNKVFSTQYFLWILPYFVIIAGILKKELRCLLISISLMLTLMTLMIYPKYWSFFYEGNLLLTIILNIRNLTLLGILLSSFIYLSNKSIRKVTSSLESSKEQGIV